MNATDCSSISDGGRESEAGFTLVEVVVALAILALSLAVLLNVISNGIRQTDSAKKMAQAGSLVQSLLSKLGTEMPIKEGLTSGEFPEGFRWRVRAERYGDAEDRQDWPVAAYAISVEIIWGDASDERSVALNTLRLAPKESGR
jgi:general secretion pathway protein I